MEIKFKLNGKPITASIQADTILLDLVREKGCYSVKRGTRNNKLWIMYSIN